MSIEIPTTNNEAWGYWGTIAGHADQGEAWTLAMAAIGNATGCAAGAVRDFLDSRDGRHFAADVAGGLSAGLGLPGAIDAAIQRWMGWTISLCDEREDGIPHGLPYLTGWVAHYEIMADMSD